MDLPIINPGVKMHDEVTELRHPLQARSQIYVDDTNFCKDIETACVTIWPSASA